MGIWSNPINKAWRRLPSSVRTGIGVAGTLGAAALTGGAAAGFLGASGSTGLASLFAGVGSAAGSAALPLGLTALNFMSQSQAAAWERKTYREQMYREDTAYQRKVRDLEAAGLNPALAYTGGGAASSAGGHEYSAPQASDNALQYMLNKRLANAQVENLEMDVVLKQLDAQKRGAELPYYTEDMSSRYYDLKLGRRTQISARQAEELLTRRRVSQVDLQMSLDQDKMALAKKEYRNGAEEHGLRMRVMLLDYATDVRDARLRSAIGLLKDMPPGLMGNAVLIGKMLAGNFDIPIEPELLAALKTLNDTGLLKPNGEWNMRNLERRTDMRGNYWSTRYPNKFPKQAPHTDPTAPKKGGGGGNYRETNEQRKWRKYWSFGPPNRR